MPNRFLLRLLPCLLASAPLWCWAQAGALRKADAYHADFAFAQAIPQYERAFAAGATSSERWYALIAAGTDARPDDLLRYSDALRSNAKYAQADSVLALYTALRPDDKRAQRLLNSATLYPWLLLEPLLDGDVATVPWNSDALDLPPVFFGDALVFASARTRVGSMARTNA